MHGGGLNFILGSIPNGADPMVEWFFLFSCNALPRLRKLLRISMSGMLFC